jgi:hypothetical protein
VSGVDGYRLELARVVNGSNLVDSEFVVASWSRHQKTTEDCWSSNGRDKRVAGVDIDLTKKCTIATSLHPMVRRDSHARWYVTGIVYQTLVRRKSKRQ